MGGWIATNWFELLQTVGIVGGFAFTAYQVRKDETSRKITNAIAVSRNHQTIWRNIYEFPELGRILSRDVDLEAAPPSQAEEIFVTTLIGHVSTVFRATKHDEFIELTGLKRDAREFFTLPIPSAVWQRIKAMQETAFVEFVDGSRQ